ncbi:VOC family protein [Fodinibius halophilus]|uniref:Glyoxalase n=1 Tax=Fodinibius halophilus TaxID=1736908 RepID=A0A6M1THC4_9BACT|nr:VOC family protein [Fodinibius halophilus]NGP88040.1 glyoxalase [Fodinibius halophilus]
MSVKRIVPNIESETPQKSIAFYEEFIGLKIAMDMDWIITFISERNPTSQISVIRHDGSDVPHPDVSIEVDNVDQMFAKAKKQNIKIVYPITDEPWGVRRFFVSDPNGKIINILSHLE